MSEHDRRRPWVAALVCAHVLASPLCAAAQVPGVRDQAARVERVRHMYEAAVTRENLRRKAITDTVSIDTATAGPLVGYTWREHGTLLRVATALAWQRMAPFIRADSLLLSGHDYWLWVEERTQREYYGRRLVAYSTSVAVKRDATPDDAAHRIEDGVGRQLASQAGHEFNAWIGNAVPMVYDSATLRNAYVELVTSPSTVAHRCFSGDLASCRVALELDTVPDPASAWYSPEERALMVRWLSQSSPLAQAGAVSVRDACLDHDDDASCLLFLHSYNRQVLKLPVTRIVRRTLVRTALAMGHDGAYTRLVRAKGDVRDKLVAAARVPLDSVMRVWHAEVLGAQPPSDRVPAATTWSTGFWILLLAAMAVRSSRWRSA